MFNSLKVKKSCKKLKTRKLKEEGFKNFHILEENIQIDENCYSIDDFYPRENHRNLEKLDSVKSEEIIVEKQEISKESQRESEISFLRPSQIKIDETECEKIFKKLEVFHEEKLQQEGKSGKSKNSKKKHQRSSRQTTSTLEIESNDENNKKSKKNKKMKNDEKDEENENDDLDENEDEVDDKEMSENLCSNAMKKNPEWNVAWVE